MHDLPPALDTPAAWKGSEIGSRPELWIWRVTSDEMDEIAVAARRYLRSGESLANLSKEKFDLKHLAARLARVKEDLLNGRGFQLIRGFDVSAFSRKEIAAIFMGIGAHIGSPRSQNAGGHLLGHVRDEGADPEDVNTRIYQTNARQTFHTDSCDVVGLCCLQTAQSGGESLLVSAETIYNEMRRRRPDLAALLFQPVATDKRGEVEPGTNPYFLIPILNWYEGRLTVIYQRQYIESAQRFEDAPRLEPDFIAALDLFDALANDASLHLSMPLQRGDIQFVHNHSMLHDRKAFADWPDRSQRRHLLRLWLCADGDRPLPPVFRERFGTAEIGNRGGIIVENTRLQVPLD